MAEKTAEEVAKEKVETDRKDIKVENNAEKEPEKKDGEEAEDEGDKKPDGEKEPEKNDEDGSDKEDEKEPEKTEAELKAEQNEATTQKEKDRIQKRIDKLIGKNKTLEDENKDLKAKLAAVPDKDKLLTEEDVEKRANTKAQQKLLETEFVNTCNKLADDATKVDKDFKKKVDSMAAEIGEIPGQMIGVLGDLDNGGAVLSYLTNNVDEAEELYALALQPAKLGIQLTKLSEKLAKPKTKEISKTPDPLETINGRNQVSGEPKDTDDMDTWLEKRNKQAAKHAERKRAGMR